MGEARIRQAEESDFNFFYIIKCEDDNIYWSGHTALPLREKLFRFFFSHVQSHDVLNKRTIFIVEEKRDGLSVGYLYLDPIDRSSAEISVGIMQGVSGQGLGRQAVGALCDLACNFGFTTIYAMVREDNIRSQNMFLHAGFEKTEAFRYHFMQNLNKEVKMIAFKKVL